MTKVNKLSRNIAIASMLAPVGVNALGIGEIQLHSALNQNFSAEIPLVASPGEDTKKISVSLAPPAAFEKAGVERSYLLSALRFKPELKADGTMSVKVKSNDAIREPFLNFLIEVKWPEGRMLKEYTVLLDPPSSIAQSVVTAQTTPQWQSDTPRQTSANTEAPEILANDTSASEEERLYGGQLNTGNTASQNSTGSNPSVPTAKTSQSGFVVNNNDTVVVPKGSALWKIADQMRDQVGVSRAHMLIALYRANPGAFYNNNINSLKAGATLKFPDPGVLDSISEKESIQAVKQHNQRWNKSLLAKADRNKSFANSANSKTAANKVTQKGRLKLTAPESSDSNGQDQALLERMQGLLAQIDLMTEENTGLKSQVSELEARIQELSKQAIESTDQGLNKGAEIQVAQTAEIDSAKSIDQTALDKSIVNGQSDVDIENTQSSEKPAIEKPTTEKPVVEKGIAKPVVTKAAVKPVVKKPIKPTQDKPESETSFLADMMASPLAIGSIAVALLLGLVGWMLNKRRKQALLEEMDDAANVDLENQQQMNNEAGVAGAVAGESEQAPRQDSELGDSVFFSEYRPTEAQIDSQAVEVDHDDLDPISEADVYVAYGRYQQAEELIQQALKEHPDRDEYKLKLLEIYHAKDDSAGFTAYIAELKEDGNTTSADFWARAEEIGADFAPDNLFGGEPADKQEDEAEEFSSELFGVDSQNESLELNDDLSEILSEKPQKSNQDIQSIDLGAPGETVDQLESAFALDEVNSETMQSSRDENDSFTVNLTNLGDDVDTKMVDSENHIASMLDDAGMESEELSSNLSSEIGIDFNAALTKSLDMESSIDTLSSVGKSESFEFDSEEVETSSWGLDIESVENIGLESEIAIDSTSQSTDFLETEAFESEIDVNELQTEAIEPDAESSTLETEIIEPAMETVQFEPLSTIDEGVEASDSLGLVSTDEEMETSDSLGLVSSDDLDEDSISINLDLNESNSSDDTAVEMKLDDLEAENVSEDFQLVSDASVLENDEEEHSYAANNDSTMFHLDDISSELVESAQISEILDEVSQRNTDFAEESVISEMFDPASVMHESEMFESELSDLDEVADKLDLAKAYIDMEDGESARGILKEVIESGSDDQKELARSMVQALEKSA